MKKESSAGILWKGYPLFQKKFEKEQTDIIKTRLLLQRTYVIKGKEASRLFYDQNNFRRSKATPKRFQKTLFGQGGVQGLDGESHRHRKDLFMHYMTPESLEKIEKLFERNWMKALKDWETRSNIVFFREAEKVLMKTACEWTQVPLSPEETNKHTLEMSQMIDASGGIGWRHYKGRRARSKAEKWIKQIVIKTRQDKINVPPDSILYGFAFHEDLNHNLLSPQIAAVELLNLLRPIVAIARYIAFLVHALHEHPEYLARLREQKELIHSFVQEVRRYYPFFPFVAAKTIHSLTWHDVELKPGSRVLLDLYATNHDERLWSEAGKFRPQRFQHRTEDPFELIPQGGGDFHNNHRCAGEWITIRLMEKSLDLLVNKMEYAVPPQDLSIALSRIPAIPKSRVVLSKLKSKDTPSG